MQYTAKYCAMKYDGIGRTDAEQRRDDDDQARTPRWHSRRRRCLRTDLLRSLPFDRYRTWVSAGFSLSGSGQRVAGSAAGPSGLLLGGGRIGRPDRGLQLLG